MYKTSYIGHHKEILGSPIIFRWTWKWPPTSWNSWCWWQSIPYNFNPRTPLTYKQTQLNVHPNHVSHLGYICWIGQTKVQCSENN